MAKSIFDMDKSARRKFTTMMDPALSNALKMEAVKQGTSVADLLEDILRYRLPKIGKDRCPEMANDVLNVLKRYVDM